MRKLLVAIFLLGLPALLVWFFLFQPNSRQAKDYFKKWEQPKKKVFSKPSSRSRKQVKDSDTLDSLLKALLSAAGKKEQTSPSKKSTGKDSNPDTSDPVTLAKTAFQSLLNQLKTDENGKMLLELFQAPNAESVKKHRGR